MARETRCERGFGGRDAEAGRQALPAGGRRDRAAYYAAARVGLHLAYPHHGTSTHGSMTAFWPPVGVGIAALVLYGPRLWPAIVIGDLLAADYSTPLGVTLGQTLGTVAAIVVAAVLLIRLGARRPGLRVRDVIVLIVCSAAGTALGAGLGMLAIWIAGDLPAIGAGRTWRMWWLSDLAGALVVTPAALTWASVRVHLTRRQMVEGAALIVALLALIYVASRYDVPYVIFPALIWASLRFGPRGAAAALLAASALTIWDTSNGSGPFVRSSLSDSLIATQVFVGVAALTSMILAAVTAERAESEAAARGLAHEQAALRRIATLVVSEADPARVFGQVMHEAAQALGAATATIVRYDDPSQVSVLGGWSETGSLIFPVGSTIEISGESSALVEVYRTGEAGRVTYPEDAGDARRDAARARLPLERRRAGQARRRALGRARRILVRRAPAAGRIRAAPLRLRRSRRPGARQCRCPRQAGRIARAHRREPATPSAAVSSATSTTARSSAWSRSPCSCG